ncbi:MAG: STAS domain-containing protein [Acidimicrobiales bacterium]
MTSLLAEVVDMGLESIAGDAVHRTGPGVDPGPPAELARPVAVADWRGDVALELWVETDCVPARIRMAGRLDSTTAANLAQVMGELMADGTLEVELCTDGLRIIDASAIGALADMERLVREHGGVLARVGPANGPFPRTRWGGTRPPVRT